MAPNFYSFEKGINSDQDYDAAVELLCELRNANIYDEDNDKSTAHGLLKLACMVEMYERSRYLIFYHGFTC